MMENIYDKIVKEIIEPLFRPLAAIALNLQLEETREIKDKIQVTLEREGDHTKLLLYRDPKKNETLHLEFHVSDENIGKLMLLKKSMLLVKFARPVRQFVLYMGNKKRPRYLSPGYKDEFTKHRFTVISLKDINWRKFMSYDVPEVITLAILGDPGEEKPDEVIREILNKIDKLSGGKKGASQHVRRLEILSNLRNLQPLFIEISSQMAFTYNLEKDIRYRQGIEKGMEQGIEKGIEKGMEQGIEQGIEEGMERSKTEFVGNLLLTGEFNDDKIAALASVTKDFIEKVRTDLIKAGKLKK